MIILTFVLEIGNSGIDSFLCISKYEIARKNPSCLRFKRDLKKGILISVSKVEIGILLWPVRLWQLSHNFAIYFFILIAFETNLNVRFSMLSYLANLNMKKNVNLIHYIYEFPCIQLCFWIGWFCVKIECLDLKYSIKSQTGYNDAFITLRFVYFKSKCYRMKRRD